MEQTRRDFVEPPLGLWDAVSIIVGIIIGVGIFKTPAEIFELAPDPWSAMGVWALGGALALLGAFCFAELASTYPRSGGEYVYLTRAFRAARRLLVRMGAARGDSSRQYRRRWLTSLPSTAPSSGPR